MSTSPGADCRWLGRRRGGGYGVDADAGQRGIHHAALLEVLTRVLRLPVLSSGGSLTDATPSALLRQLQQLPTPLVDLSPYHPPQTLGDTIQRNSRYRRRSDIRQVTARRDQHRPQRSRRKLTTSYQLPTVVLSPPPHISCLMHTSHGLGCPSAD